MMQSHHIVLPDRPAAEIAAVAAAVGILTAVAGWNGKTGTLASFA